MAPRIFDVFTRRAANGAVRGGRSFACQCGAPVFFDNTRCLKCHSDLGYEPELAEVIAIEPAGAAWRLVRAGQSAEVVYRRCANLTTAAGCNWLVSDLDRFNLHGGLCISCRLNRTIPDLSDPVNGRENGVLWGRIEFAKRRMVSSLLAWDIPVVSKKEDQARGLAFDFLRSPNTGPQVMTGHADGLITLNIEEARSSTREQIREEMGEPYRTILGHLRHEVGHYYWDRLIAGTEWIDEFRRLFGDERQDYAEALRRNYREGPPADWASRFISSYASCHPWEDWAETWAHMLHLADTLATALSFGLDPRDLKLANRPFSRDVLFDPADSGGERLLEVVNGWITLTAVMNELSRSMGDRDFYPFTVPGPTVTRLHFMNVVIRSERNKLAERQVKRPDLD